MWGADQELAFPFIVKSGVNGQGKTIRYYFNYSDNPVSFIYPHGSGRELHADEPVEPGQELKLERWGMQIIEEI
ncbi:hypothetical protein D3C76_1790450 [compost metagenome]